ncbi:MAG: polyprenyl synthetase family protein [archaeon]
MDVMETFKMHKERIDKELNEYLMRKKQDALKEKAFPVDFVDRIIEFNMRGGKRVRPALMVEGYKAVGGQDLDAIYKACVSIEVLEGYLLIHDDIMDQDELRRGGPTIWKSYADIFEKEYKLEKVKALKGGWDIGIVAGDVVETFAYDILANSNFPPERRCEAINRLATIERYTGFGQFLDYLTEVKPLEKVTEEEVLTVHKFKTAYYTILGPLQIGMSLGGAKKETLEKIADFGIPVGIAFQVYDDMLGLFGDEKKLGKPVGSDVKEGKRTLLILKAIEKGTESDRKKIKKILGKKNLTMEELEEIREIVRRTGSYDYSKNMVKTLTEKGKEALKSMDISKESKEFLLGFADWLISREV